jgi:hypothetical protein
MPLLSQYFAMRLYHSASGVGMTTVTPNKHGGDAILGYRCFARERARERLQLKE